MASYVVNHLVGMITSTLQNEASLLLGVYDELDALRDEFVRMKSFLKDADSMQLRLEGDYAWVANVRDLAYQSEDIIDEFMYNLYRQQRPRHFTRYLHSIICIPMHLLQNHHIAKKLQDIKKKIEAVHKGKLHYYIGPQERSNNARNLPIFQRNLAFFIKDEDVIGLRDESEQFEKLLIDEGESKRTIISVVGMGGSGKTTLVTKIYNIKASKHYFDCYGWITVSQTYIVDDLLRRLIKEFHKARKELVPDLTSMEFNDLVSTLISYLEQKRYLVVLDDVWDTNVWETMGVVFTENQLGSRVIITTRNEDVGSFSPGVKNDSVNIQPLNNNEAWELFCRKAFASYPDQSCPKELQKIARDLVGKCRGLPLAIVTMAGLMSSKKSVIEWTNIVYNNLNWQLINNTRLEAVQRILLLSYIDLSYPLKHCFLYCCLFPEDYRIKRKRLIRLWIAEGFVQQDDRVSSRQVAESYLMELIYRGMLQVLERNEFGRPKTCKMHDLLRELALSISEKENFCTVHDGRIRSERCKIARRFSIRSDSGDLELYEGMPQTRSLLVFSSMSTSTATLLMSKKLKLARILDLENTLIEKLPDEIGNLYNLRYLNLRGTKVKELPTSIRKLYNLETLDMRDTLINELPKGIEELENLQHLIMFRYNNGSTLDFKYVNGTRALFQINKLRKLEVMSFVEAKGEVIKELGTMTRLTRMGISNLSKKDEMELCSSIQNLENLQYLFLMASSEEEFLPIDSLESPPMYLHLLILAGKLERVPLWFHLLHNLTHLFLHWSRMKEDPLPHISKLQNLGRLDLSHAYIGRELHFQEGFTKLRKLYLFNFPNVTMIRIENGVMSNIEVMHLYTCTSLTALPQGIEFLKKLETLTLPVSLGNERDMVQHVANVYMW